MNQEDLQKEISKLSLSEIIKLYEAGNPQDLKKATKRLTLGRLDVIAEVSAINSNNLVIEYSLKVHEGILCNVKGQFEEVEKMVKELNKIILQFQR